MADGTDRTEFNLSIAVGDPDGDVPELLRFWLNKAQWAAIERHYQTVHIPHETTQALDLYGITRLIADARHNTGMEIKSSPIYLHIPFTAHRIQYDEHDGLMAILLDETIGHQFRSKNETIPKSAWHEKDLTAAPGCLLVSDEGWVVQIPVEPPPGVFVLGSDGFLNSGSPNFRIPPQ